MTGFARCAPDSECPLNPTAIFWVNTALVWWPAVLALAFGAERPFATLCLAGITVTNSVAHALAALIARSYNPGLASALLVFVPLSGQDRRSAHDRVSWAAAPKTHAQELGGALQE